VYIKNFRTHKERTDTFPEGAITHITGGNGAGKSSIVNAIPWALFGTRPTGVTKNIDLRRENTDKLEPTVVALTYTVDGEKYVATRTMNHKGNVQVTLEHIDKNGAPRHVAGTAVKDGNREIMRSLGMSEDIFKATILFRQKETDHFINSRPDDRRKIIEELTGITANSYALEECGVQRRAIKREVDNKTVDRAGIEAHKQAVAELAEREANLAKTLENQREKYRELIAQKKAQALVVADARRNYMEYTNTKTKLENREERLAETKAELERTREAAKELENRITNNKGEAYDYTLVEAMYQEKFNTLQAANTRKTQLEETKAALQAQIIEAETVTNSSEYKNITEAKKAHKALDQEIKDARAKVSDLTARLNLIRNSLLPETEAGYDQIANLDGTCPTCQQVIQNKERVLKPLQETIINLTQEVADKQEEHARLTESLTKNEITITVIATVIDAYTRLKTSKAALKETEAELKKAVKKVEHAEVEHTTALNIFNDVKKIEDLARELERLNSAIERGVETIARLNTEIASLKQRLNSIPKVTERALASAEEKQAELDKKLEKNTTDGTATNTTYTAVATQHATLKTQLTQELKDAKAYESLLKEQESNLQAQATLEEFRRDVTAATIPQLSQFASELITGFTNGTILTITITEDFNVQANFGTGETREVSLLSGGELSAVSLAIGLAMAKVFGGSTSTLILDEAFTAYDPRNMDATIKTIRSVMDAQQIIIIAHNDAVDAVADYQIEL
jgi:exonuclease SbcC